MSTNDLATLTEVKAWLNIPTLTTSSDVMLAGIITAVSRTILGFLNRSIVPSSRTEIRDGTGGPKMILSEWPVLSITSLTVDGQVVAPQTSPPFGSGYMISPLDDSPPGRPQRLTMPNQNFTRGMMNVVITYVAGYQVTGESRTIPITPFQITALAPYGDWASDQGVTFASNGVALVAVAAAPAAGQYSVDIAGKYTFAAADAGKAVSISYGYIPAELKQATIEAIGERFKYRDRVGVNSKTLAGQETVSFSNKDLTDAVKLMLAPYQRVVQP